MPEYITFRTIAYDTAILDSRINRYCLFREERLINQKPITSLTEPELVKWLFNSSFVQLLLSYVGINQICFPFFEKPRSIFSSSVIKDGDYDVIFCENGKFDELICMEFKKIKYEELEPGDYPKINCIRHIPDLMKQGNWARQAGFYKTFIVIASTINLSKKPHPNTLTKFDPEKEYKQIYEISNFGDLENDVGIFITEIEQPTGLDYNKQANIKTARLRDAVCQKQKVSITQEFKDIYYKREIKICSRYGAS